MLHHIQLLRLRGKKTTWTPIHTSQKINQRMRKWVALHIKEMIQNTYLLSQSADLCLSLSIYNSLPCAALLGQIKETYLRAEDGEKQGKEIPTFL